MAERHDDQHGQCAERTFDPTVDEKRQDRRQTAEDPDQTQDAQQRDRHSSDPSRPHDREIGAGGTENEQPVPDRAQRETEPVQVSKTHRQPQQVLQIEQPRDRRSKRHLGEQPECRDGAGDQVQQIPPQAVALDREENGQEAQCGDGRERQKQDGDQDRHRHRLVGPPHGVRERQPCKGQQQVHPASRVREGRHRVLGVALAGSRGKEADTWIGGGPSWPLCAGKTRPPADSPGAGSDPKPRGDG